MTNEQVTTLIKECQVEASKAIESNNPPFGCVITDYQGKIVMRSYNTQNTDTDPTAHAEIKALRQLGAKLGTRYLDGYSMFSNAESCVMCMAGCIKAHITTFYYGAPHEKEMDPSITAEEVGAKARHPLDFHGLILAKACAAQIAKGRRALRDAQRVGA